MEYSDHDHSRFYKAYFGDNNKSNIFLYSYTFFLLQKLLSKIVLLLLSSSCLLFGLALKCNSKNSDPPDPIRFGYRTSLLLNHPTRSSGTTPTFYLDLDVDNCQNGEDLALILVKNKGSPVDLVKAFLVLHMYIQWNNQPNAHIYKAHHDALVRLQHVIFFFKTAYSPFIPLFKDASRKLQKSLSSQESCSDLALSFSLQKSPSLFQSFVIDPSAVKDASTISNRPDLRYEPLSLFEELRLEASNIPNAHSISTRLGNKMHLPIRLENQKTFKINKKAFLEVLQSVKMWAAEQRFIIKIIEETEIVSFKNILNNQIKLGFGNKMQSALRSALHAVKDLKSALLREASYQLGIEYNRPVGLRCQRSMVIKALENLQKELCKEWLAFLSVEASLNLIIEFLEKIYHILFDITKLVYRLYEMDGIKDSLRELSIADRLQFKKVQDIIVQLGKMGGEQLSMVRDCRKKALAIQDILVALQKDLITLRRTPLELARRKIYGSNLKRVLQLEVNIIEGKLQNIKRIRDIITDLELEEEAIKAILDPVGLSIPKIEMAAKYTKIATAIDKALYLERQFKKDIPFKSRSILYQVEMLKKVLQK